MKLKAVVETVYAAGEVEVARLKFNSGGFAKVHCRPGDLKAGDHVTLSIDAGDVAAEKAKK